METKLRQEIVRTINNDLLEMGSTGKSDELIQLTTKVVTNTKRLLIDGVPEAAVTKTTASLTQLVLAAKDIAQNPAAPNFAQKIKHLSEVRRVVDGDVKELDDLLSTLSPITTVTPNAFVDAPSTITPVQLSDREKKLLNELISLYKIFSAKKEVQKEPPDTREKPEEALKYIVGGIGQAVSEVEKLLESPVKESLLEPTCLLCKMISKLLDIEDSLFINRFPMRSQMFEFTDVIISTMLRSKKDSRNWIDQESIKTLRTQIRALLQAIEVVVEQCYKRTQALEESWHQSIKRKKELDEMESSDSPSPEPLERKQSPELHPRSTTTFKFSCVICSSTGFDPDTDYLIPRGKELTFRVPIDITVGKLKHKIKKKTTIPVEEIQLCQGQEPLPDSHVLPLASTIPYFLFNINEPTEDETKEMEKQHRRQKNVRVEDIDWSMYKCPIAVALYDYDTEDRLGEDGNLSFFEGEIIEVTEKSHDGWWEGRIHGKFGVFPASFVLELQNPNEQPPHAPLAPRGSVDIQTKPVIMKHVEEEPNENLEEVHPEPEIVSRSRIHSFTAGFKKPFRKKKDSPKLSPRPLPKNPHSPMESRQGTDNTTSSPLLKTKVEKQLDTTNNVLSHKNGTTDKQPDSVPRASPRPKRPPPPKPPPYRKKSAVYVQLEEDSADEPVTEPNNRGQPDSLAKGTAQLPTEHEHDDKETEVPCLYEVPISQKSTLEPISEGDGTKPGPPVAPPRRRKNGDDYPKVAPRPSRHKISLGRIPKVASAPIIHNGESSAITTRKTSDVVVAVQPPKYSEEELAKCTGVGKNGHLFIEETGRWHERIFKLERDRLVYQDRGGLIIVGEVLLSAINCVTEFSAKRSNYYCFAIHLKEESSIVLGSTTPQDMHDWAVSITKITAKRAAIITEINDHLASSPAYLVAMECITYLLKNGLETDKIFRIPGNVGKLKKYLDVIDSYKKPSLDDMPNANTAASLLKSMFKNERIDVLVPSDIVTDMCIHVQRNGPVSRMRDLCLSIPDDKRVLLAALIQLFSQIIKHSQKNHTDIATLNKQFGEYIFEQCPSGNSESILAYIIDTYDTVLS